MAWYFPYLVGSFSPSGAKKNLQKKKSTIDFELAVA
jgi:hypothetical protein